MAEERLTRRILVVLLVLAALAWAGQRWFRPAEVARPADTAADSTAAGVRPTSRRRSREPWSL